MRVKSEKYAAGKYMVYVTDTYPATWRRAGHVTGGKSNWLAESGPDTVGHYKTLRAAKLAIERNATKGKVAA